MDPENILKLQKCRGELLSSLEFDLMTPSLIQNQLLSDQEYDYLKMKSTNSDKISSFLELLGTKNNKSFEDFLVYLEDEYDWLAHSIKNTHISSDQITQYTSSKGSSRSADTASTALMSAERDRLLRQERHRITNLPVCTNDYREREKLTDFDTRSDKFSTSGYGSERGYSSPVHSSDFSLKSSHSGDDRLETLSSVSCSVGDLNFDKRLSASISEDMIDFVKKNPRILRKWQSLAHSVGMSDRVEVIKARIRSEGRDFDEHVEEFLREWSEFRPETANLGGLIKLLRSLHFNDTALKLENGRYMSR